MSPEAKKHLAAFQIRIEQAIPDRKLARLMKEQVESLCDLMIIEGKIEVATQCAETVREFIAT